MEEIADALLRGVLTKEHAHEQVLDFVSSEASQYHLTSYTTLITLYALDGGIVLGVCCATGRG